MLFGLVAQLVRAPPCHGGGRGFEPHPGRLRKQNYIWDLSSAGRASALQAEGHRFEPCRFHFRGISAYMQETVNASNRYQWKLVDNEYADMAQLAEQLICNQQVEGSSPPIGFMDH